MNKILIIDDDEDDHFMFKEAIAALKLTIHCDTATNGKLALEKLKANTTIPDIIFLDLNMPIMNGYDFLIQIKKDNTLSNIPVCIFSTSNLDRDKQLTKEHGAIFFLTKPNYFQKLCKQLQQILSADFSTGKYLSVM